MKTIFKRTRTEKGILIVYLTAFILLLLSYLATLYANRQIVKQADQVDHTNSILKNLDDILGKVKDGETGVRGYVLTGKLEFLYPYYGSHEVADSLTAVVAGLTNDNPIQQERLKNLQRDIDKRFEILRFSLNSFNDNNRQMTDTMLKMQQMSIKVMDDIRMNIIMLEREENKLLVKREAKLKSISETIDTITIISLLLAFSLVFFGFITYMKVSRSRKKGKEEIAEYQEQLKKRITDLDKVNAELIKMRSQEKFAATGRIARTIAHEVRNPLTNINLAADQLKSETEVKEDNAILFEMITRNSARINQLISDLLNSTKFSELVYEKMSINKLLDEAMTEAEDRIALSNITVVKKYSTDTCDISVDKQKIKIAFLNIIINAIEAMENKEGAVLTIETMGGDKCTVIISDNGSGLDNESVSRLFEPYFTSKLNGNGLGLTNTQNIILNHKGEITVESIKNKGTSFTIKLDFAS